MPVPANKKRNTVPASDVHGRSWHTRYGVLFTKGIVYNAEPVRDSTHSLAVFLVRPKKKKLFIYLNEIIDMVM